MLVLADYFSNSDAISIPIMNLFEIMFEHWKCVIYVSIKILPMLYNILLGLELLLSSDCSMVWLPNAVFIVSLDPPVVSGTCKLFRFTFKCREGIGLRFWRVDMLSTSMLVPDQTVKVLIGNGLLNVKVVSCESFAKMIEMRYCMITRIEQFYVYIYFCGSDWVVKCNKRKRVAS